MGICEKASGLVRWGLRPPYEEDGLYRFEPPHTFSACRAVTLGGAMDGRPPDPEKIILKLSAKWVRASAQQLRRALAVSNFGMVSLLMSLFWPLRQVGGKCDFLPCAPSSSGCSHCLVAAARSAVVRSPRLHVVARSSRCFLWGAGGQPALGPLAAR